MALVKKDDVEKFIKSVIADYYEKHGEFEAVIKAEGYENVIFASDPCSGALVFKV